MQHSLIASNDYHKLNDLTNTLNALLLMYVLKIRTYYNNNVMLIILFQIFDKRALELASIDLLRGLGLKGGQILAVKNAYPTNMNVEVTKFSSNLNYFCKSCS